MAKNNEEQFLLRLEIILRAPLTAMQESKILLLLATYRPTPKPGILPIGGDDITDLQKVQEIRCNDCDWKGRYEDMMVPPTGSPIRHCPKCGTDDTTNAPPGTYVPSQA